MSSIICLILHRLTWLVGLLLVGNTAIAQTTETLTGLYKAARLSDPVFSAAVSTFEAQKQDLPRARSALLPTISGFAEYAEGRRREQDSPFEGFGSDFGGSRDTESQTYGVRLSQTIYNHGLFSAVRQARAQVDIAELDYLQAENDLIIRVAEAYFATLTAQNNLRFAEKEQQAVQRQLREADERFEVGFIAVTDVREAQARFDLAVADTIAAENEQFNAYEGLRALTGVYSPPLSLLTEELELVMPDPATASAWVDLALENNLELRTARANREVAKFEAKRAHAQHYPTLELEASHVFNDEDGSAFGSLQAETTEYRLRLNVPVFEGGLTHATSRQAAFRYSATKDQYLATQRQVVQQTRNAFQQTLAQISRVRALARALNSTQVAYEAVQSGFEVGSRTTTEVILALQDTLRAQSEYLSAQYSYLLSILQLKQAAGLLSELDLMAVNEQLVTVPAGPVDSSTPDSAIQSVLAP